MCNDIKEDIPQNTNQINHNQTNLMAIDWPGCVKKSIECSGNAEFAATMLSLLVKDLVRTQKTLVSCYGKSDYIVLREELHRIHGGLCYLELPELTQTVLALHQTLKIMPNDKAVVEKQYQAVMIAIQNVMKAWDIISCELMPE